MAGAGLTQNFADAAKKPVASRLLSIYLNYMKHTHDCSSSFTHHRHARGEQPFGEGRGRHGGEHRWGGGRFGGGRGGGRALGTGELRLVLLHLIQQAPRHGYEIIRAIEELTGGAYSPSPGVIYPTLTMLDELGHVVAAQAEGGRKLHTITAAGEAELVANRGATDEALRRLSALAETQDDHNAPPILRAMMNLKMALRLRLERGRLQPGEVAAIAAAIDAAAVAVEQS
jgi:DNA-binding PadR family transcriptional regulator